MRQVGEVNRAIAARIALSASFAARCMRLLATNRLRAIAPCPGVDLEYVLKHARSGRRRGVIRDGVIVVIFLWLMLNAYGGGAAYGGVSYGVVAAFLAIPGALVLTIFLTIPILIVERLIVDRILRAQLTETKEAGAGDAAPDHADVRTQYLRSVQNANVLVHSGFDPFESFGTRVGGWSVPVDVSRGAERAGVAATPKQVDPVEIISEVSHGLLLAQVPSLKSRDFMFVNGRAIRGDTEIVPDPGRPPVTELSPDAINALHRAPRDGRYAYRLFEMSRLNGQLILTVLMRVELVGTNAYLETEARLLTPVTGLDDAVRRLYGDLRTVVLSWLRLIVSAPIAVLKAPARLFGAVVDIVQSILQNVNAHVTVRINPYYDRGAEGSLRYLAEGQDHDRGKFRSYMEYLEKEMFLKVIDLRLIDQFVKALELRDVDTQALRGSFDVIMNNGVILHGDVKGDNVTIAGNKATTIVERMTKLARTAVTGGLPI